MAKLNNAWLPVPVGFVLAATALYAAQVLDSVGTGVGLPDPGPFLVQYLFAGLVFAIGWLPAIRQTVSRHSISIVTACFALFLAFTLFSSPEISARWLIVFYALEILLDRVVTLGINRPPFPRSKWEASSPIPDAGPHAPFIAAGLLLLALVPIGLLAGQQPAGGRIANWAFGFLVLGATIAALQVIPIPGQLRTWKHLPDVGTGIVILTVWLAAYAFTGAGLTRAESTYIVDLNPNYLATRVRAGDIILSDSPELNLSMLPSAFPYLNIRPDQRGTALWDDLKRALQVKRRVFWTGVPSNATDQQGILATFLKTNGCLDDVSSTTLPVRVYEMRAPLVSPQVVPPALTSRVENPFDPVLVDFGPIQITGVRFERQVCSHDAVAIAIRWQLDQPTVEPLKLSLSLSDGRGRQVQVQDWTIEDPAQRSTDAWDVKSKVSSYYILPIPYGTAPGDYGLAISVYSAGNAHRSRIKSASGVSTLRDVVVPGSVHVYRPENPNADPYRTGPESGLLPARVELQDGLQLDAYGVSHLSVMPGTDIDVTARWLALKDNLPNYRVRVQLLQDSKVIVQDSGVPVDGTYPTGKWVANEPVLDHWSLRVPPDAVGGKGRLEIGAENGRMLYVADIDVAAITRTFQIPAVTNKVEAAYGDIGTLIGYDVERAQLSGGDRLGLTLYWRATSSQITKDYAVFAQLLAADGHLVAQSDGAPAGGARPTRSWLNGEIIQDARELNWNDPAYHGEATLIVGLYDPITTDRVPFQHGKDNAFELPARIQVTPH